MLFPTALGHFACVSNAEMSIGMQWTARREYDAYHNTKYHHQCIETERNHLHCLWSVMSSGDLQTLPHHNSLHNSCQQQYRQYGNRIRTPIGVANSPLSYDASECRSLPKQLDRFPVMENVRSTTIDVVSMVANGSVLTHE